MDIPATAAHFQTTNWTLIANARSSDEEMGRLLSVYWRPVYAYLRRKGRSVEDAMDLTQGFITTVVLERDLIGKADRDRGRFRSFLLFSLDRFVIDQHRLVAGRDGAHPKIELPTDAEAIVRAEPTEYGEPADAFARQWATTVMEVTMERLEDDCKRNGRGTHWRVFEAQEVNPALHGSSPLPADELARRVGVGSRDDVYNMLHTMKRRFRRMLREVVAETVDDPADVDDELAAVIGYLAR